MNHQQQSDPFYANYNSLSRSSSSARGGYATASLSAGMHGSRQNQRDLQTIFNDERFGALDASSRFDRIPQGVPSNNFMLNNNQAWNYNGNVATVSGADMGRVRSGGRRQNLPTEWTQNDYNTMPQNHLFLGSQHVAAMDGGMLSQEQLALHNGAMNPGMLHQGGYQEGRRGLENEGLIPTAIVIKNIPFAVRKETILEIMTQLNLPQPYAFNYHFDNGVFRGLAFANFQSSDDVKMVITRMNGLEVQGRKLRVEYKKQLPEAERERIEREKREKRGQLQEQHQPLLHPQSSMQSLTTATPRNSPLRDLDLNDPETLGFYTELTLFQNDPNREIFVFPENITPEQRRRIHILAHNMGLQHESSGDGGRRQLQVLKRGTVASASPTAPAHLPANVSYQDHRRGLSRAATIDFAEQRGMSGGNYHTIGRQGPTLELPGSPEGPSGINGLRGVKSFADLRSYSPSPAPSNSSFHVGPANGLSGAPVARYGDYSNGLGQNSSLTTPTTPGSGMNSSNVGVIGSASTDRLVSGMGSISLGGIDSASNTSRPSNTPGAIGSQRPGGGSRAPPERQPRGPTNEWETSGFGGRNRTNGHMQRGSDSSDNALRGTSSSNSLYH